MPSEAVSPLEQATKAAQSTRTSFSGSTALFEKAIADKKLAEAASKGSPPAPVASKEANEAAKEPTDKDPTTSTEATGEASKDASPTAASDEPAAPYVPKTAQHWKEREKSFKAKEQALLNEIQQLKAATGDSQVAALKAEISSLKNELKTVAIERDPDFQKEWRSKQEAATARLRAIAPKAADRIIALAALPADEGREKLIDEMIADLPPRQQAQIGIALHDISKLTEERSTLMKSAEERLGKAAQQTIEQRQQERQHQEAIFEEEVAEWEEVLTGFDPGKLKSSLDLSRRAFIGDVGDDRKLARLSVWAAVGQLLAQDNLGKEKQITELKAQLAALKGAQPTVSASAAAADPEDASRGKRGSFGMSIAEAAKKSGLLAG